MNEQQITYAIGSMLETALWSSTDIDTSEPLDTNYGIQDIHPEATTLLIADLRDFIEANEYLIEESNMPAQSIGHYFWLTRNRHGAGFWDLGLGKIGDQLTEAAHAYGEIDLYVGDDGTVYA